MARRQGIVAERLHAAREAEEHVARGGGAIDRKMAAELETGRHRPALVVAVDDPLAELVFLDHLDEPRALDLAARGLRDRAGTDQNDARRPVTVRPMDAARDLTDQMVIVVGGRV